MNTAHLVFTSEAEPSTAGKLPPLLNAKTMEIHHLPLFLTQNKYLAISTELLHNSSRKHVSKI